MIPLWIPRGIPIQRPQVYSAVVLLHSLGRNPGLTYLLEKEGHTRRQLGFMTWHLFLFFLLITYNHFNTFPDNYKGYFSTWNTAMDFFTLWDIFQLKREANFFSKMFLNIWERNCVRFWGSLKLYCFKIAHVCSFLLIMNCQIK